MKRSKRASKKSPRVSVTLTKEDSERLDRLAQKAQRSRSWLGNEAIRRLLNAYDAGQLELPLLEHPFAAEKRKDP
jgi:metal-responsive CopG/Arc/MetJ family transcriptional regulator